MLITDLLAGLSAKTALGLGIAATTLTGAGVAIALPDAAGHATNPHPAVEQQEPDTTVAEPTTEVTRDDGTEADAPEADAPEDEATDDQASGDESGTEGDGATTAPEDKTLPAAASFGQSVAADARDGGVDGQQISEQARTKPNPGRDKAADTPAADHTPPSTPHGPPPEHGRP